MKIRRRSPISDMLNELDLPVTEEQIENWQNGMLIQDAMPQLTPAEREFIMSGVTVEEWEAIFGSDEE